MIPIIDPHVHFFDLTLGQYDWLTGANPPPWPNIKQIKQNHGPEQLRLSAPFYLAGVVHIEAGFDNEVPRAELDWLACRVTTVPYQAIAYLDITSEPPVFANALQALLNAPRFLGIRDITEGTDINRLIHKNTQHNLALLAEHELIFEAQFELDQQHIIPAFFNICNALPALQVIINHSGFMQKGSAWSVGLETMARCNNVAIKFSGQEHVETPLDMGIQLNHLLNSFGTERVMFASNYPVSLMRDEYCSVWQKYYQLVDEPQLWKQLSYSNAKRIYRL